MEVTYQLAYHKLVPKVDIPRLPLVEKERVQKTIQQKLTTMPDVFGKPLRQSLKGHWGLRIGDYRAVYRVAGKVVKIFAIEHRSKVYGVAERRVH